MVKDIDHPQPDMDHFLAISDNILSFCGKLSMWTQLREWPKMGEASLRFYDTYLAGATLGKPRLRCAARCQDGGIATEHGSKKPWMIAPTPCRWAGIQLLAASTHGHSQLWCRSAPEFPSPGINGMVSLGRIMMWKTSYCGADLVLPSWGSAWWVQ